MSLYVLNYTCEITLHLCVYNNFIILANTITHRMKHTYSIYVAFKIIFCLSHLPTSRQSGRRVASRRPLSFSAAYHFFKSKIMKTHLNFNNSINVK